MGKGRSGGGRSGQLGGMKTSLVKKDFGWVNEEGEKLGRPSGAAGELEWALYRIENQIAGSSYEIGLLFTKDGVLIERATGNKTGVGFVTADMGNMILTHTHPNGAPFSDQDIVLAGTGKLAEIRATAILGGKRVTYVMRSLTGNESWPSEQKVRGVVNSVRKSIVPRLEIELDSRPGFSWEASNIFARHLIWKEAAPQLGLSYRVEYQEP